MRFNETIEQSEMKELNWLHGDLIGYIARTET